MNQNTKIIAINDKLVSKLIKQRDPMCVLKLTGCTHYTDDPMHIFNRRHMMTRWNLEAVYGGCRSCHSYTDTHPEHKKLVFIKLIGKEKYGDLDIKSKSLAKYSTNDLKKINKLLHLSIKLANI